MKKILLISCLLLGGCGVELRLIPSDQAGTTLKEVGQGAGNTLTAVGTATGNPLIYGAGLLISSLAGGGVIGHLKDKERAKADKDYDEGVALGKAVQ